MNILVRIMHGTDVFLVLVDWLIFVPAYSRINNIISGGLICFFPQFICDPDISLVFSNLDKTAINLLLDKGSV